MLFHSPFIGCVSVVVPRCYMLLCPCVCSVLLQFKCFYFNTTVCPIHLFQQCLLSCHLFGKELLTRLIICYSVVCKICLSVFLFDVLDGFWVLILPVPEVSLLL